MYYSLNKSKTFYTFCMLIKKDPLLRDTVEVGES